MILICDDPKCKKEFEVNWLQARNIGNGVIQEYFTCPHCKKEYLVTKTNKEIKDIQTQIEYYANKAAKTAPGPKKRESIERMNALIAKKRALIEKLESETENGQAI